MLIPIGDDVNTRTLPVMATALIAANIMLWVHTGTLWRESRAAAAVDRAQEGEVIGADARGRPVFATAESKVKSRSDAKKWERFMREWGLVPSDLAEGQVHGVMSHLFLHADWVLLVGNMVAFWAFVGTLEATLGAWKTLLFYLFWGVIAGLAHAAGNWGSNLPYVGASGAIAGVIGAYFYCFGARARIRVMLWVFFGVPPQVLQVPAGAVALVWAGFQVWGWFNVHNTAVHNAAWFAYAGGFGAGILTMFLFRNDVHARLQRDREGKWEVIQPELPTASGRYPIVAATHDTVPTETAVTSEVAAGAAPLPRPRCSRCFVVLSEEHRMGADLYRCPNCKMLTDTAPPPPPPPKSSGRYRTLGSSSHENA